MKQSSPTWATVILTALLFLLALSLFPPSLNSDDDFFFLYTLAGGHGAAPSHLLHYLFTLHPLVTWPLPFLFRAAPGFNWYTMLLVLVHFTGCLLLFRSLLRLLPAARGTIAFLLFFLFVEAPLLQSLNYSGAALTLSIGGLSGLITLFLWKENSRTPSWKAMAPYLLVVLVAGLFRFHILGLMTVLLSGVALLVLPLRQFGRYLLALLVPAVLLLAAVAAHRSYYTRMIPQWEDQEAVRQAIFRTYNHPFRESAVALDSTERIRVALIQSLVLYDSAFTGRKEIEAYADRSVRVRDFSTEEDRQGLYWTFIHVRVHLLLLSLLAAFFILHRSPRLLARWLLILLGILAVFGYFVAYLKISGAIFYGTLAAAMLSAFFIARTLSPGRKPVHLLLYGLLLLNCGWMSVRLVKTSRQNIRGMESCRAALREIADRPGTLFVLSGPSFPYGRFPAWDVPARYALPHLIYKERILTFSWQPALERFGLKDLLTEAPASDRIFFIGAPPPLLADYYRRQKGRYISIVPVPGFQHIKVFRLQERH